jgi:hypothetical protein
VSAKTIFQVKSARYGLAATLIVLAAIILIVNAEGGSQPSPHTSTTISTASTFCHTASLYPTTVALLDSDLNASSQQLTSQATSQAKIVVKYLKLLHANAPGATSKDYVAALQVAQQVEKDTITAATDRAAIPNQSPSTSAARAKLKAQLTTIAVLENRQSDDLFPTYQPAAQDCTTGTTKPSPEDTNQATSIALEVGDAAVASTHHGLVTAKELSAVATADSKEDVLGYPATILSQVSSKSVLTRATVEVPIAATEVKVCLAFPGVRLRDPSPVACK